MPVGELAKNFSRARPSPTKELYSMAGLVFLADFFGWTAQEAIEVYIFRSDVQYALNLEPGVTVSTRMRRTLSEECFAMTNWPSRSSRT